MHILAFSRALVKLDKDVLERFKGLTGLSVIEDPPFPSIKE